jgi:hypothetical protein
MFPWELVLGLVQGLVTHHTAQAEAHTQTAKEAADLHADVTAIHKTVPPAGETPTNSRLELENDTLKRAIQLMIRARAMFPDAAPKS